VPRSLQRLFVRFAVCSAVVAAITALYTHALHVNPTTVALTLLVAVLTIAAAWGLRYSVFTSLIATACFNFFFLPPVRTWTIADPQNWVALAVFLITAMIASHLSDKARRQAKSAESRRHEIERLYAFSQQLLIRENVFELLNELPKQIVDEFSVASAAIFLTSGQKVYYSDVDAHALLSGEELKAVSARGEASIHPERGVMFVPLRIGVRNVGSLAVIGNLSRQTLEAIGSLVAIATERAGAVEKLSHAEAARENERLRSALLDAVAHEFRTPLTSIKAAASTLSSKVSLDDAARRDLVTVVEEEADRLNRLVGEAAEMARLDAHKVHLEFEILDMRSVVDAVLKEPWLAPRRHEIELMVAGDLPRVRIDRQRIAEVIRQLLENAVKYSPVGTSIHVIAERERECVRLSVADQGPGIDDFEQSLIFEKFYRGRGQRGIQGTGMGLPIAKAIIEAHGGTIAVTSQLGRGSVFQFSLPALAE
jgi:two-component system, OmpR family, sensor histidine kinase KdpD